MQYILRDKSLLTGKPNLETLYTLKDFPVFMGCVEDNDPSKDLRADMAFDICRDSGLIQLGKLLPLDVVYLEQHNDGTGSIWNEHYELFCQFLARFSPKKVLEIGAANARVANVYLKDHPDTEWTVIEPHPIFEETDKIKIIKAWFDHHFRLDQTVDTVIHTHVLEHVYEPIEFLEAIHGFLKIGDKHVFAFPNMLALLEDKALSCMNFEHTYFVSEAVADTMLQRCGFKILDKQYFHRHSIFYATEKVEKPATTAPIENHYTTYKQLFMAFIDYYEALAKELNEKVSAFDGEVYLFGAHIFSQYLIGFGLDPSKIVAVLDNSPIKIGKRLYGTPFRVESPKILRDKGKVMVILKAGAYNEEIRSDILENINPHVVFV